MHSILITDCKTSNNAGSIFHTPSLSRFITGPLLIAIYHHFPRVFSSSSYPSSHSSSSHSSSEIQCAGFQRGPGKTSIKRTCLSAYLVPMASHTHPQSAELVSGAGVALMKVTSSSSRVSRETLRCILFAPPPVFGLTPLVRMSSVAGCFRNFTKGMDGTIHWTENKQPAMPTCNRSTLISFYILVQPKKKENSTDTGKHPV